MGVSVYPSEAGLSEETIRKITVFFVAFMLMLVSGRALAAEDLQQFVGTWKGYQGRRGNVIATYTFWMEENRLVGKSQYVNLRHQTSAKGILGEISVSGNAIQFLVTYKGGRFPGTKARYKFELKDSTLEGTGYNINRDKEFEVSLKKTE